MSRFVVDQTKCRRDGICAAVCPMGILTHSEAEWPGRIPGGDERCILCGHCVAACPHGACSLDTMPSESCPPQRPEWHLDPERAEHFLRTRRSIRCFKSAPVDQGRLARLIRAARHAPSGHNQQPVRWLVISGSAGIRAIAGHVVDWMRAAIAAKPELGSALGLSRIVTAWDAGGDLVCYAAPHLIVAHAAKDDLAAPIACTLALAHLELAAPAYGLGACWGGFVHMAAVQWPPLQQQLALPAGEAFCGAMMVGEPRYRFHRQPTRREPEISWRND